MARPPSSAALRNYAAQFDEIQASRLAEQLETESDLAPEPSEKQAMNKGLRLTQVHRVSDRSRASMSRERPHRRVIMEALAAAPQFIVQLRF